LQGFLGGIENLPHYSPENRSKAITFWQSWQNEKNGLFYNPFFVDPANPASHRTNEGYDPERYHRRGKDIEKVNQKYLPLVLTALGAAPLYQVEEERRVADENIGAAVEGIESALKKGARGQTVGNQVTRQIWLMADHIDRGRTELIPDYEHLMALLLHRFNPGTGLLGKPDSGRLKSPTFGHFKIPHFQDYSAPCYGCLLQGGSLHGKCFESGYARFDHHPSRERAFAA
jgi:hypothetical protein